MVPSTTTEHAQAMLAYINVSVAPLGIVFKARITNIVWLLCLGCGSLAAAFDVLLYAAYNSFNIALCDDDQILNLLPVAGTARIPGSASTLVVTFSAASTGPLTVPIGTQIRVAGEDYLF
jgi:repressor of nif and glnA expression